MYILSYVSYSFLRICFLPEYPEALQASINSLSKYFQNWSQSDASQVVSFGSQVERGAARLVGSSEPAPQATPFIRVMPLLQQLLHSFYCSSHRETVVNNTYCTLCAGAVFDITTCLVCYSDQSILAVGYLVPAEKSVVLIFCVCLFVCHCVPQGGATC